MFLFLIFTSQSKFSFSKSVVNLSFIHNFHCSIMITFHNTDSWRYWSALWFFFFKMSKFFSTDIPLHAVCTGGVWSKVQWRTAASTAYGCVYTLRRVSAIRTVILLSHTNAYHLLLTLSEFHVRENVDGLGWLAFQQRCATSSWNVQHFFLWHVTSNRNRPFKRNTLPLIECLAVWGRGEEARSSWRKHGQL